MFERLTRSGRRAWAELKADEAEVDAIVLAWTRACEGTGLHRQVTTVTGPTVTVPRIVDLTLGPPMHFEVQLLPGQVPGDLAAVGRRIAPWLGGRWLRVTALRGGTHARIEVVRDDPLDRPVTLPFPVTSVGEAVQLGEDEEGAPVGVTLPAAMHMIVQGASGSGKSVGCYGLLGQLATAPDVMVAGSDITNLLLAPWAEHRRSAGWHALGTGQPMKHVEVLERLVKKMDSRVAAMPERRDAVELGPDCPLVVVVLEEYPGLLRVLRAKDKLLEARARAAVGRLLAEGRKAGFRVVIITQRADADIIGGYERGQASHTISYRVDNLAALKMLHPDVPPELAAEHATALPGVALVSAPGVPLTRVRSPYTTFGDYWAAVDAGAAAA